MKTAITMVLAILIAPSLVVSQSYSGGSGTYGDPYHIATKADLKYLSENSGEWSKFFIQTANISFSASDFQSGGDFYNSGAGWIPIGTSSTNFVGIYDGGGYFISNLYINRSSTDYVGFIGFSGGNEIKNINLVNVDITGRDYTGGLLGHSTGDLISKCRTTGTVSGQSFVGGLIGERTSPQYLRTSFSSCSVTGSGNYTGGLVGFVYGTSLTQSNVENCYATGPVNGNNTVAGLIGGFQYTNVTKCYSSGAVTGTSNLYGLCGYADDITVTLSFWDETTSGRSTSGGGGTAKTTAQMKTQSTYTDAGWDFSATWQISGSNYPELQGFTQAGYIVNVSAATNIGSSTATLSGNGQPNNDTAAVRFLYGTSSGVYTDSLFAVPDSISGDSTTNVSLTLTGLQQGTKYYYTISISGSNGYSVGDELSFTTISTTWGSTVKFGDASNQYAKAGGVATTAVDNVTLEAWIKWDGTSTGSVQGIVTNGYAGSDGYGLYLYSNNKIALLVSALLWAVSDSIPSTDTWIHLAVVRNSGTWAMFMNGEAISIGSPTTNPIAPYTNLFIGGDSVNYKFHGEIDEVRVSDIARYTSNFSVPTAAFSTDGNTVGLYHFDEGSGSTVADASSQSNDLALFNSPTWMGSNNPNVVPLPVELTSFTVSATELNSELRWKTATEVNNHGFEIERKGKTDWSKIGFIEGNGTTNAPKEYSYIDRNTTSGTYQYRLKQIDRDGKFEYSKTVEVTIGGTPTQFSLDQNHPNPFNPSTMISFQLPSTGRVSLKIYDVVGREVATLFDEVKSSGNYSVSFDGSRLSSGIYFAKLQSGEKIQLKKMMLLK